MSETGEYLCEELIDEVRRGDIPIYRALINLRELYTEGLISQQRKVDCRKDLNALMKQRMDKE